MADIKNAMHGSDDESGQRLVPTFSYNDKVKNLFLTKSTDKSKKVLFDLISGAVDVCDGFLLRFEESHIEDISKTLSILET